MTERLSTDSHVQAWREYCRQQREWRRGIIQRAIREWADLPDCLSGLAHANNHLAAMPDGHRKQLEAEWSTPLARTDAVLADYRRVTHGDVK